MIKTLTLTVSVLLLLFLLTPPTPSKKSTAVTAGTGIEEKAASPGPANLQQGSWYNSAIENITNAEYEFKKDTSGNRYCTPNRKNNLRFFYDDHRFTVEPRTTVTEIPGRNPTEITHKELPRWKVAFNLNKKQIGKGCWSVAANKAEYITDKVTVQYINNEKGMRQNFIVASPLSGEDELKINLGIKTSLKVQLQDNELQFFHKKAGNVLNYSQLKVWDANNQPLAANFEKNGTDYCINVHTKGAAYPITIDPISSSPSATMETNQANAQMGISISSAGDVNGDGYSDVIVGAHLYDNGQTDEGRAYIYHGSDTGTSATAATILESNQANAQFGIAVATAGDVNSDGYSDIVVGANLYDGGQTDEGAVFVYHGSATGVNTTTAIRLESNVASSNFGISVACAGDVNGDGFSDIITGSNLFSFGQTNEGVAIVYRGSATGIVSTTAAILQMNQAGARMGTSVASAGDINGDGFSDVIIGIPLYNGGLAGEGAAVTYTGSATGINVTATDTLESNQLNANMGQSVSSAGDVNGDGYSDVVIGANLYETGQTDEGAAFVYQGSASGLNTSATIRLESNAAGSNFGIAVACSGDNNGDGYSDVIIGANLYDNGQTDEGAAFVYRGSAAGIIGTAVATLESNQAAANFGIAVASAGDVNGDGYSDVMVGANFYDNGETDEGAAFVYNGSANSIRLLTYAR
ncbi:MAG: FG-GAP repeat protein [Chitinophagaceae bacterium]|nr:FG-GAP repeat protein [Chitinophagaceae bacterium]